MSEATLARMRDQGFSHATFLGGDESLDDIVANDAKTLADNGLTWQDLCNVMHSVYRVYSAQETFLNLTIYTKTPVTHRVLHTQMQLDDSIAWRFTGVSHMGYQQCPFPECCDKFYVEYNERGVGDTIVTIEKLKDGAVIDTLTFGTLLLHLAHQHQFLQGHQCRFRVDPQRWIDFFDLKEEKRRLDGGWLANWLCDKCKRETRYFDRIIDPMPEYLKFYDGVASPRYV
jgi:hypothetical protein